MKKCLIACVIACCLGTTINADTLCDFSSKPVNIRLNRETERSQKLEIIHHSDIKGNVALIGFLPGCYSYCELIFLKTYPLAANAEELNGKISLEISSPTPDALRKISIRLSDRSGEIFQLSKKLSLRQGEWTTLSFDLSPKTKFYPIWGGDKNRQLDYPVRLWGISADFDKNFAGRGSMMLDDISWLAGK